MAEVSEATDTLGVRIDRAGDAADVLALDDAIAECQQRLQAAAGAERATLHYFLANAWDGKRRALRTEDSLTRWEQPEIELQVLNLRLALRAAGGGGLEPARVCQVLTNLGNSLSHLGRPVEAIECWDRALAMFPAFAMARGNRGCGLIAYARLAHDPGHRAVIARDAHQDLTESLRVRRMLEGGAEAHFRDELAALSDALAPGFIADRTDLDGFTLGDSPDEVAYRRWVLGERLFLNDLNDLGAYPVAAADVLVLPGIVQGFDEGPHYVGFFNQMKQEYVSARFILYEGLTADGPHFSDHDVTLINTLDYPSYSLSVEKIKMAFRAGYSLFDKIAFFLDRYLAIGTARLRDISFKTIWYDKREKSGSPRPTLEALHNNALRGLFWLAKDLSEAREGFVAAMDPDGQDVEELRQCAEHRYLKLHEFDAAVQRARDPANAGFSDTLARSITRAEFEQKALRMLRMARAALIYVCAAVHLEERRRAEARGTNAPVVPMYLGTWEDRWKR
jgi:tetratricopeptide (TPR) repeat protein